MAESRRNLDGQQVLDDEAQKKKDRLFLVVFAGILVGAVILIILLSKFLSNS